MADLVPELVGSFRGRVLRVCVDLNVWCAAIYADARGRRGSAAQSIAAAVRRGESALGEMQLVVSWGMLSHLRTVLHREFPLTSEAVDTAVSAILHAARYGPQSDGPHLLLGGGGVLPLRDEEDAHVLEVALAGHADLLVTSNFADFISYRTQILVPDRVALHASATARVLIVHPFTAAEWMRNGQIAIA